MVGFALYTVLTRFFGHRITEFDEDEEVFLV